MLDDASPTPRAILLTPIMAPYRVTQFDALARRDIDLRVVYLARTDPMRQWPVDEAHIEHEHAVLREIWRAHRSRAYVHLSYGLHAELRAFRPQVVVAGGWDQLAHLEAFTLRRARGYRFLWWVESTLRDRRPGGSVTEAIKRRLVRGADGILVPGSASAEYVRALGARKDRVFIAPNAVDHAFFASHGRADRSGRAGPVRFLFVGRLEPEKGLAELMRAWESMAATAELTVVGDGALRDRLERWAGGRSVRVLGHLDREPLAEEYARADVFVLPSRSDPWGLVINEAMAAGLPVIASRAPGAVDDLVDGTGAGLVVPVGDVGGLESAMRELAEDPFRRSVMGERAAEVAAAFTPQTWAAGVEHAIRAVLNHEAR